MYYYLKYFHIVSKNDKNMGIPRNVRLTLILNLAKSSLTLSCCDVMRALPPSSTLRVLTSTHSCDMTKIKKTGLEKNWDESVITVNES